MLDFRHETFLALCKIKNYTKTADALHITQPAVSQHIKFLEEYYKTKLFFYHGKALSLTENGEKLQKFALTMSADSEKLRSLLSDKNEDKYTINFGATLTIGEYVMPQILCKLMEEYPNLHITLLVDNTKVLLSRLRNGEIDFALLEGFFDKSEYGNILFSKEEFIPVCSVLENYSNKKLSEIYDKRLILREKGSGTRDIFEQLLSEHNLSIASFKQVCEVGNINAIKQLVIANLGITFLYKTAVLEELRSNKLTQMQIDDFTAIREFNFVYLKNSLHEQEYVRWYNLLKNFLNKA